MMYPKHVFFLLLLFLSTSFVYSQNTQSLKVDFFPKNKQVNRLDEFTKMEWRNYYELVTLKDSSLYRVPFIATEMGRSVEVLFAFQGKTPINLSELKFKLNDHVIYLNPTFFGLDSGYIKLPGKTKNYSLKAYYRNGLVGQINIEVYQPKTVQISLIPTVVTEVNTDDVHAYLDSVYFGTGVNFIVKKEKPFSYEQDAEFFANPSPDFDRYTDQMKELRDAYFSDKNDINKDAYHFFIIPGFVNDKLNGFMVRNKAIGFVKSNESLNHSIAQSLGRGMGALESSWEHLGPTRGSTDNLLDNQGGTRLLQFQWQSIQANCSSVSYYDDYEDVRTNNGFVAFFVWEEDANGNIVLKDNNFFKSITRPFKRNNFSIHLEVTNVLYYPIFYFKSIPINALHFIVLIGVFILFKRFVWKKIRQLKFPYYGSFIVKLFLNLFTFILGVALFYGITLMIDYGYRSYRISDGEIKELNNYSTTQVVRELRNQQDFASNGLNELKSQLLIKKKEKWYLKRKSNVLYFQVDSTSENTLAIKYLYSDDSLKITSKRYYEKASSHYIVLNYNDKNGSLANQKVYNHLGTDLTDKLELKDPAKRILLFVNGYRPTSLGRTFEENFNDVLQKGVEYPNSTNMIYGFDRYEYWRPWNEIDLQFSARINPAETFYADGHFSVSTSNHRSLINFSTLSSVYPKRCENQNFHICQKTKNRGWSVFKGEDGEPTVNLFNLNSNKKGFQLRRENGKIAGRNLLQMLNELPNSSENDTLFIVAHSMGFAYSLGITDVLKGKIVFGGYYIVAAENASEGQVNANEWNEVWQYGGNFQLNKFDAPCLLDGVAPQTRVSGLKKAHQVFIPENLYNRQGFFDSHFIGYYSWIFNIKERSRGYIRQR